MSLTAVLGGGVIGALISAAVSFWNNRRSLNVQRLVNSRSVSTFIADKRQRWIDDLRTDVSKYLSLSLEIAEGWRQLCWRCGAEYDEHWHHDPQRVLRVCESLCTKFLSENATRDSEHHQLHIRIVLRLNSQENVHQSLIATLDELRTHMRGFAMAVRRGDYSNQELFESIEEAIDYTTVHTKIILKQEWQRLKREVADPDRLIREVLNPKSPDVILVGDMPRRDK